MSFRPLVAGLTAMLALTACTSDTDPAAAPDPQRAEATKLVELSPLTGLPLPDGRPDNPVFVVKIENTEGGEPQINLNRADLVMEELVEGGLTRLAAFYYSVLPSKVGHVRSLRATDIGIASPVKGQIVASGGAGGAVRRVKSAGVRVFSEDGGAPGFSSDPNLFRPYNRLIDLKTVNRRAKNAQPEQAYLPWTPEGATADPGTSKTTTARTVAVRFSNSVTTRWKLRGDDWVRTNGHAAKEFRAANLVVMFCEVGDAGYTDPAGNPVPETKVEGTGRAIVFHGDQGVELTWKKAALDSPITFTTADDQPYTIDPGKTFVELVPKDDGKVTPKA